MAAVRAKSLLARSAAKRRRKAGSRIVSDKTSPERRVAGKNDLARLKRLEARVARVLMAVEDELDYRLAVARWENHVKNKTKLHTGEEVWRELGLSH